MEFEQIMNMVAYYTPTLIELVTMGLFLGFTVVTVLSLLAYGIFKAFALVNVKK